MNFLFLIGKFFFIKGIKQKSTQETNELRMKTKKKVTIGK